MTAEIILLVIGGLFFVISFFLPDGKKEKKVSEEEIRELVNKEVESARGKITDMVEETSNYSVEKTERALEKLCNEKIMYLDEYAETVLKKINDNHQEAVFLYDMLNSKDEKIKNAGDDIKADIETMNIREKELKEKEEQVAKDREDLKKEKESLEKEKEDLLDKKKENSGFTPFVPERVLLDADGRIKEDSAVTEAVKDEAGASSSKTKGTKATKATASGTSKPRSKASKTEKSQETDEAGKAAEKTDVTLHFESDNSGRGNQNELIQKLHEEGLSNMQIAKKLGLGVGEVKLVIDLFASRK